MSAPDENSTTDPPGEGPRPFARPPRDYVYAGAIALAAMLVGWWLSALHRAPPPQGETSAAPTLPSPAGRTAAAPGRPGAVGPTASPARPPAAAAAPPSEATGAVGPAATPADAGEVVSGVPEVVDTVTLRIADKLVHLLGVEWARGGRAEELSAYIKGRPVQCRLAKNGGLYRCSLDGRDLAQAVLFNGGARATADATPQMRAAEERARIAKVGVWAPGL